VTQLRFDSQATLLIFPCTIEYQDIRTILLALDTGCSFTIIQESSLIDIGYSLEAITQFASFGDASKSHLVPKALLKSFSLADAKIDNLEALSYTIPEEYGIDGVIGLNFLRHFNISLGFEQGMLTLNCLG
jgi:hypothetical protein